MDKVLGYDEFLTESKGNFNFKDIFLQLTEYTIPYGYEEELEPILMENIPGLQKDSFGNYHITIGDSRTLFTSHLDTYSKRHEKINHVFDGSLIKTDETTVLGGDNKNGVLILMYMIQNNIPGTYYFFLGEEGIVTGKSCNGSSFLLESDPNLSEKFDRAIAFDRRGEGSIVIKQRGRMCCSTEFADALVEQFGDNGLPFKKDYAYGTDSAVFINVIPEITNISSGGRFEHAYLEATDIEYLEKVAKAAIKMDWEGLPTERTAEGVINTDEDGTHKEDIVKQSELTFKKVQALLGTKGFNCINENAEFSPNRVMLFSQFVDDNFVNLRILGDTITIVDHSDYIKGFESGTIQEFTKYFELELKDFVKGIIGRIVKKMNIDYELPREDLDVILDDFMVSYDDFINYIKDSEYKDYFKFDGENIWMDVKAGQGATIKRQMEQENKK
jgi:hypothetical protein